VRGPDIEEYELVGPFVIVASGRFHGVARILEVDELHPLDHAAAVDIEAGNDSTGQHPQRSLVRQVGFYRSMCVNGIPNGQLSHRHAEAFSES
jgi:hypothetical protein